MAERAMHQACLVNGACSFACHVGWHTNVSLMLKIELTGLLLAHSPLDTPAGSRARSTDANAHACRVLIKPDLKHVNGSAISAPFVCCEEVQRADTFAVVGCPALWACLDHQEVVDTISKVGASALRLCTSKLS